LVLGRKRPPVSESNSLRESPAKILHEPVPSERNVFNHPNFNIPNRIAFTSNFGQISSAQDSRQLQIAIKLIF
jgi:hypothetical protein